METKKLILASLIGGIASLMLVSCEPEIAGPADFCSNDSLWYDPYDTTNTGGVPNDSTFFNPDDSTNCGGGTDTTNYGGGWGTPGDSSWYGGGTDTTYWGDSTNFGG